MIGKSVFFVAVSISLLVLPAGADMIYTDNYMARTGIVGEKIDTGYTNHVNGRTLLRWRGGIRHLEPIYFSGSNIRSESYPVVEELKNIIASKDSRVKYISIIGHSSSAPDKDHSVKLNFWSTMWQKLADTENIPYKKAVTLVNERISAIYSEIESTGFDTRKIYTENRVDRDPISTEATAEGRRKNNRVDVTIYY